MENLGKTWNKSWNILGNHAKNPGASRSFHGKSLGLIFFRIQSQNQRSNGL